MKKRLVDITSADSSKKILKFFRKSPKTTPKNSLTLKIPVSSPQPFSDLTPPENYHPAPKTKIPSAVENIIRFALIGFFTIVIITAIHAASEARKIQKQITDQAYAGLHNIVDASQSTLEIKLQNAKDLFSQAVKNFEQAQRQVWFLKYRFVITNDPLTDAVNLLLESGEHIAIAGDHFVDAVNEFTKIPIYFLSENTGNPTRPSITTPLKIGLDKVNLAITEINRASDKINQVNTSGLPPELSSQFNLVKTQLQEVSAILDSISTHFPAILQLLGESHPHRYLILLQNDTEIRPSGGFIGNYGLMDVNNGYIESFSIHDVYALDNFYTEFIEPHEELKDITSNWRLRDSNYSHHFPLTAEKARWFLETEGGPTVDTVIALNQSIAPDLLRVTGPIHLENFGSISADNYYPLLTYVIESKLWGTPNPKEILNVLINGFKSEAARSRNLTAFARVIIEEIKKENIMIYSSHEDVQDFLRLLGVSGEIKNNPDEDYLSIVHISVGGTKTDIFIDEKITHHTHIDEDGQITNELTIVRTHTWTEEIYREWEKLFADYNINPINQETIYTLGRGHNQMNTRIYIPTGSTLITDQYTTPVIIKHDPELNLDYFYLTSKIFPGESHQAFIKYRLPTTLKISPAATYRLQIDKQPGNQGSIFTKTLSVDSKLEVIKNYPASVKTNNLKTSVFATNLLYDRNFAAIITK